MNELEDENRILVINASLDNLELIRDFVSRQADRLSADSSSISELQLAVDEAVTNIIMHGYKGRTGKVEVEIDGDDETLFVRIRDTAPVYDVSHTPEPDLSVSPMDKATPGGYGVFLIQHMVDAVDQRVLNNGQNELILRKRKSS